ncbi:hypothetical protein [Pelagibius sp. 7325]|uniref:hypothetical protein n=1 Tax=Pelagibius sp. 7325 TaxID=3131994 RepID=UPI0030EEA8CC
MFHVKKSRPLLAATMLVLAGLVAGCESDIDRQMRLEREALEKSGELEELEGQLNTKNPDPYSKEEIGTKNLGRSRQN